LSAAWPLSRQRHAVTLFEAEDWLGGHTHTVNILDGIEAPVDTDSHLRFGEDGRVAYNRDYWDTAEELYAKIPGLDMAVRWLQRRAG
jgi:protoporphyrinogen oxidase